MDKKYAGIKVYGGGIINEVLMNDLVNIWNARDEFCTIRDVSEMFDVCTSRIRSYLRIARDRGLVEYDIEAERKKGAIINSMKTSINKHIKVYVKGVYKGEFPSVSYVADISEDVLGIKLSQSQLSRIMNGHSGNKYGFEFKIPEKEK